MQKFQIGRFELVKQYRDVGTDRGPAIHLFGPTTLGYQEILRFDCFEDEPHYHIAFSYKELPFRPIKSSTPFEWAKIKIANDIVSLLQESEAEPMIEAEIGELKITLEGFVPDKRDDP